MPLIFIAFLSGVLTALAPCVLPIIPVVIGGSISGNDNKKPYVVVSALMLSIVVFTLLLKGSTVLISVPDSFWRYFSGGVIILFALTMLFPIQWASISVRFYTYSQQRLSSGYRKGGLGGAILIGLALGPVFTSCSPVYLFILSAVLPQNFVAGLIYIIAYALGLCSVLLLVGIFGQRVIHKFDWASNPNGWFKKIIGALLLLAGLLIITGFDRKIQQYVIERNILDITKVEHRILGK